ncbi:hypothetical protein [Gluconobacter cerinus]|uniref:hypothetical protein n=1 Tax=Gluconobacter cerinus TaxID=38307 RepID=UPI0039EB9C7C
MFSLNTHAFGVAVPNHVVMGGLPKQLPVRSQQVARASGQRHRGALRCRPAWRNRQAIIARDRLDVSSNLLIAASTGRRFRAGCSEDLHRGREESYHQFSGFDRLGDLPPPMCVRLAHLERLAIVEGQLPHVLAAIVLVHDEI